MMIAFIVLGVGYAAINNINLIINGTGSITSSQNNFIVKFLDIDGYRPSINRGSPNTVSVVNDTYSTFDISTLSKKGDSAVVTLKVKNESNGVGADISLDLNNSNTDYFKVTEHIDDTQLQAGDITTVTVTVEMIKTPVSDSVSASIGARLIADPVENANASGNNPANVIKNDPIPDPVDFENDSWATIKKAVTNNDTSNYSIGDTKVISMDLNDDGVNEDYTVRISNIESGDHCGDNDTAYSQTACGFVVEFTSNIALMKMRDTDTSVGGYPSEDTLVYTYLRDTLYNKFSQDLQDAIAITRVISGHGNAAGQNSNFVSYDKLYLLSTREVFGDDLTGNNFWDSAYATTKQLKYYEDNNVREDSPSSSATNLNLTEKKYGNTTKLWWLRNADFATVDCFDGVSTVVGIAGAKASYTLGVSPAFRIG